MGFKDESGGLRLRRKLPVMGAAGALLVGGALALFSTGVHGMPPEHYFASTQVELSVPYFGPLSGVIVEDANGLVLPVLETERSLRRVDLSMELPPGRHDLRVSFSSWLGRRAHPNPIGVVVDLDPPELTFEGWSLDTEGQFEEQVVREGTLTVRGVCQGGHSLRLGARHIALNQDGQFETSVPLSKGQNRLKWTAGDRAGNRTEVELAVFWDTEDPEVIWRTAPGEVFNASQGRFELDLSDDGEIAAASGLVPGGGAVTWSRKGDRRWVVQTSELPDGEHTLEVKVVDRAGRVRRSSRTFVLDSTDTFGEAHLTVGARGPDIEVLHRRLKQFRFGLDLEGPVYTTATAQAVRDLQAYYGLKPNGVVGKQELRLLGPHLYVNLQEFALVLDRPGLPAKRYTVGLGTEDYPTQAGLYYVYEKVVDPTWLPPDSDWAKDAKPTPPGPDNPLGTRWIGLDWGGLGIHGTNAPWTVGSATSHGCLRMLTEEVEELFTMVEVGMPVTILSGHESNAAVERFWSREPVSTAPLEDAAPSSG